MTNVYTIYDTADVKFKYKHEFYYASYQSINWTHLLFFKQSVVVDWFKVVYLLNNIVIIYIYIYIS